MTTHGGFRMEVVTVNKGSTVPTTNTVETETLNGNRLFSTERVPMWRGGTPVGVGY